MSAKASRLRANVVLGMFNARATKRIDSPISTSMWYIHCSSSVSWLNMSSTARRSSLCFCSCSSVEMSGSKPGLACSTASISVSKCRWFSPCIEFLVRTGRSDGNFSSFNLLKISSPPMGSVTGPRQKLGTY